MQQPGHVAARTLTKREEARGDRLSTAGAEYHAVRREGPQRGGRGRSAAGGAAARREGLLAALK